jgi:hypothetical protein
MKWWQHADDIRLEDVKTFQDQFRYSQMMYRRRMEIGPNEAPDAILDLDRFPEPELDKPWMHGEWHIMVAKAEQERRRLLREMKGKEHE